MSAPVRPEESHRLPIQEYNQLIRSGTARDVAVLKHWVVDVERRLVIRRGPSGDAHRDMRTLPRDDHPAPLSVAIAPPDSDGPFAHAFAERT